MTRYQEEIIQGQILRDSCTIPTTNDLLFGIPGDYEIIPVTTEMLSRHFLLMGGIGTGKSNTFNLMIRNIRNIMDGNDVMVIFDTKGDYRKEFYREGDIIISNDSTSTGSNGPDYWNIYNEVLLDSKPEENINELARALFSNRIEHTTQPFFPTAAKDLFAAIMTAMIRDERLEPFRNNEILCKQLYAAQPESIKKILNCHPDLKAMRYYIEENNGQTQGVISELQQFVREIFVGNFKKCGTLSMRDIIRKKGGRVVFVEYDIGIGEVLSPVYRVLIDQAIKETLCRKSEEKGNVYFILDEFKLLPHLQHIDDGINFGRSLGAKFIIGLQNINQIRDAYGLERGMSTLAGIGTTISFRVRDYETREYIKKLYGERIVISGFLQKIQTRGMDEKLNTVSVVNDEDVLGLRIGEAIVGTGGCEPFVFKFSEYQPR